VVKLTVLVVGRPGALLADAIQDYEQRAARYFPVAIIEVKAEKGRPGDEQRVRQAEAARLLARVPSGAEVCALTRDGDDAWSSTGFARYLTELATRGRDGAAFLIGGAFGLAEVVLQRAERRLRLSTFTLPHDLARLVLAEQLYRAGTILRGEPYHKGDA
jgi:23S rRNA (pseudouridine1915-N3)-methyltransferase